MSVSQGKEVKAKISQWDLIKLTSFCSAKETIKKKKKKKKKNTKKKKKKKRKKNYRKSKKKKKRKNASR